MDRYHRQTLLPFIGAAGQDKLAKSRVLLVGVGALGGVIAEQLVRAGVGHLTIADRDVVEWTNLQRQVLFDEADANDGVPKSVAAARRLMAINSGVVVNPVMTDVHAGNIESLLDGDGVDLILDGTDNVETRYLVNDVAVKLGIPWVYGACVGTDGRVLAVRPGATPCLRCVFPNPPAAGELPTCDTAGVLGPAAGVVASLQAIAAIKILTGHGEASNAGLMSLDLWNNRWRSVAVGDRQPDCRCCGERDFEFLNRAVEGSLAALCGRNAVQVRPMGNSRIDLVSLGCRLASVGRVEQTPFLLRCHLSEERGIVLTVFADARSIVAGTNDVSRARTIVSRYIGC
jgi:molybdopterin/thiamine biosynthesis adenylyltransferase